MEHASADMSVAAGHARLSEGRRDGDRIATRRRWARISESAVRDNESHVVPLKLLVMRASLSHHDRLTRPPIIPP